jgi:uncharacterized protein (TIGR03435 family)
MLRLAVIVALDVTALIAQDIDAPAFEVASVKPTGRPPVSGSAGWTASHGSFTARDAWVRGLIAFAHGVRAALIHGGPAWVDTEQFDVIAKAERTDAGEDQMKAMLRTLLADRFKLAAHRETRELPIYALTVGKSGPKMQEAQDNEKTYASFAGKGHFVCTRVNILTLIIVLSNTLAAPVHDETGLTGFYSFSLEWTDPLSQRPGNGAQQAVDSPPDIFKAVQEQLGLKLNAKKGPVDILVIDYIEKPADN